MKEQDLETLFIKVKEAHQKRVDKGLVAPIEYNEQAGLEFAYETLEEAGEYVREFPNRKAWKAHTPVDKSLALGEGVDTLIMLIISLSYLDINSTDLYEGVLTKLGVKREDWLA